MKSCFTTIDVTGAVGMNMGGYSERTHGNEGVHDAVYEKIAVLESVGKYLVVASGDFIGVNSLMLNTVRNKVKDKTGIPEENIILTATHTHSSYAASRVDKESVLKNILLEPEAQEIDYIYFDLLVEKIIGGIVYCFNNLENSKIYYNYDYLNGLGSNRNNPDLFYDNKVHVITIKNLKDEVTGVIASAACHPTILNSQNYMISADYPGYFRKIIEKEYDKSTCIFLQGAAGEVSTRYTRKTQDYRECVRMGRLLAGKVIEIISNSNEIDFYIKSKSPEIVFDVKEYESDEILLKNIEEIKRRLIELEESNASVAEIRKMYVTLQGYERTYEFKQILDFNNVKTNLQIVKLGGVNIVGIPGEPFGEICKKLYGTIGENTMILGYCNDYIGYIVSEEGLNRDGYEKEMMFIEKESDNKIYNLIMDTYKEM